MYEHMETVELDANRRMRLLSHPLIENGELVGVVQVGQELGPLQETIEELRLIYLVVGPFAIFWLCLGCWLLAERTIAPIIEVTEAAQGITADNLTLVQSAHLTRSITTLSAARMAEVCEAIRIATGC